VSLATTDHLTVSPIADADLDAVVELWTRCDLLRPWNNPRSDIAFARNRPNSDVLVGRHNGTIVAAVVVGHDGHRGTVYYVAVDPHFQNKGFGRAVMSAAENWLRERGIAKLNLMVRAENGNVRSFYDALGYGEQARVVYAKWLDGRAPTP
jgi:ribosomal protein S18 acetylase RimI-like enzyme